MASESVLSQGLNSYSIDLPDIRNASFTYSDERGFLYIAGSNGLFRFNGRTTRQLVIRDPSQDSILHSQNIQSSLFPAADGGLWFTTYEALHRYDPEVEEFRTYQYTENKPHANSRVFREGYRAILLSNNKDTLWLKAKDQLLGFDLLRQRFVGPGPVTRGNFFATGSGANGEPLFIGLPWNYGKGIDLISRKNKRWTVKAVPDSTRFYHGVATGSGEFYLGGTYGLYRYRTGNSDQSGIAKVLAPSLPNHSLTHLTYDSLRRKLILYYPDYGYLAYNPVAGEVVQLRPPNGKQFGAAWLAPGGSHWLTSTEGYDVVMPESPLKDAWVSLPYDYCVTEGGGGHTCRTQNGTFREVGEIFDPVVEDTHTNLSASTEPTDIRSTIGMPDKKEFFADQSGRIYQMGNEALYVLNKPRQKISTFHFARGLGRGIADFGEDRIIAVTEGRVGWMTIENDTVRIRQSDHGLGFPEGAQYTFLRRLNERTIAVASRSTGFYIGQLTQGELRLTDSIHVGVEVFDLVFDPEGEVYYLGSATGLWRYQNGRLARIELSDNGDDVLQVWALSIDQQGILWLGTSAGLFSHLDGQTRRYTELDGLPAGEIFEPFPVIAQIDGSLLFTTSNGVLRVNPTELQPDNTPARPYISQLWINGAESDRKIQMERDNRLDLDYYQNDVQVRLSTASGATPWETYRLKVRLTGDYDFSQTVGNDAPLRLPGLRWGHYTLTVGAINHNGVTVGKSTYQLVIDPPFYLRWWFILLTMLTLSSVLYLVHYMLVRRALAREVRRRELQEHLALERDRIAEEVHDDLGGQLSSIMFLAQSLALSATEKKGVSQEIQRIGELARGAILNVRDIIYTLDASRSSLRDLYDQFEFIGRETFAGLPIDFKGVVNLPPVVRELSSKEKRNLTLLVKESFNNIIKHAGASGVVLCLTARGSGDYTLSIQDDGVGMAATKQNSDDRGVKFGLRNMQRKCEEIGANLRIEHVAPSGTRIVINYPKSEQES
ncbi:histidine kinase [Lewinella sp. W8]|uniref:sensor histidine kinase n=1 Tax=Lewinella sp. W8 TaxID=2528208 RepID=UPI0015668782|nr:histidine kinase [Lewinella sp. W8]